MLAFQTSQKSLPLPRVTYMDLQDETYNALRQANRAPVHIK